MTWLRRAVRSVCSYCGVFMGEREPMSDDRETHGVCPPCAPMVLHMEFGEPLPEGISEEQYRQWEVGARQRIETARDALSQSLG
jgi:hypothetical protein